MLTPPEHLAGKEAQYVFGALGSWKSSIWASYAEAYRQTGTPGVFYVISTEGERAAVANEAYPAWRSNVNITEVDDWSTLLTASDTIKTLGTADDWIVIDTIGFINQWCRDEWFEENWEKDWVGVKIQGNIQKSVQEVGSHNWTRMNSIYETWLRDTCFNFKGHRFAVCQSKDLSEQWDKPSGFARRTFGHVGEKPSGNLVDYQLFHSFLHVGLNRRENVASITTIKDRSGREYQNEQEIADLAVGGASLSYLQGVAGWVDA